MGIPCGKGGGSVAGGVVGSGFSAGRQRLQFCGEKICGE